MDKAELIARSLASMEGFVDVTFLAKQQREFEWGEHHRRICRALDDVVDGKVKRLIINIAPRYGKTELVSRMFVAYGLALNPRSRFILVSYSDDLVQDSSRDISQFVRSEAYRFLYPATVVKGKGAKKWETTAGGGLYAVSSGGQLTGFGAGQVDEVEDFEAGAEENRFSGAIIVDDPIKPEDALSDLVRDRVNARFDNTIRSRVNSRNTPIIIIMQRLHEKDLCGHLLEREREDWTVISFPCLREEDGELKALWEFKHTKDELLKLRETNLFVFETQYQQNARPVAGLMYPRFRTYDVLPARPMVRRNYTDTADTGSDFLCSIDYAMDTETHECYVLDVLFTDRPMEYTEPECARMITKDEVEVAVVESNNGGRGFRRNVEKGCRALGNAKTVFVDYTQTQNKASRILSHSTDVMNTVYFPREWEWLWPDYANAMKGYRRQGRNAHDDAPDATTGLVEHYEDGFYDYMMI